jgi:Voltage gated chloride channel
VHMQHWYTDLLAAGAGAGVAAGFGAPMSGVLFAVETLLLNPAARRATQPPPPMQAPSTRGSASGLQDEDDGGLQVPAFVCTFHGTSGQLCMKCVTVVCKCQAYSLRMDWS